MDFVIALVWFCFGLALIIKGGDKFVDASVWLSDVSGISKAVIGATLVSFATTSPEYFVSLFAVIKGHNGLSIGNAVGSLSVNLGLGFGLLAAFTPSLVKDKLFSLKGIIMIVSAVALWFFCSNGVLGISEGLVLLALFSFSIYVNIRYAKEEGEHKRKQTNGKEIALNAAMFVLGAGAVVLGSNLMVDNGKIIAATLGMSDTVIGLTVVAIGTSLPEIATSITAIAKKQNALSLGNIVGANILDTTLILSTGAFVSGGQLTVPAETVRIDLPVVVGLMLLAVLPVVLGKRIYRLQGLLMMTGYLAYLAFTVFLSAA